MMKQHWSAVHKKRCCGMALLSASGNRGICGNCAAWRNRFYWARPNHGAGEAPREAAGMDASLATFIAASALFAAAAACEGAMVLLQKNGRALSRAFGKRAFGVFVAVSSAAWIPAFAAYAALQLLPSPGLPFGGPAALALGAALVLAGAVLLASSFSALGWKRTYNVRLFEGGWNEFVKSFPYSAMPDPMYAGGALFMFGLALSLNSLYDFLLAIEASALMALLARAER
jgi:hypothetical protein